MAEGVVLIDTDAWSMLFGQRKDRSPEVAAWRRLILGRLPAIGAQTEAELRFGAGIANWGPRRVMDLESLLARTPTLPVTPDVIRAFASLKAECRRSGHPLAGKHHTGDLWIAATATAYNLQLLSGDRIFGGVPGLNLLAEP